MSPRRLLIVEYLCAGFANLPEVSQSMLSEGRAMLLALLEDAQEIDGLHVTTLWNESLGPPPAMGVTVMPTTSPTAASRAWRSILKDVDLVYIIAPETDGILRTLCEEANAAGARVLNCTPEAIEAASDKWETFLRLTAARIPTIDTRLLNDFNLAETLQASPSGCVIKPRFGCGSEGIHLISDVGESNSLGAMPDMIVQPFLPGQPASVAALFDDNGYPSDIFPVAIQRLTSDLRYVSGCIPAVPPQCSVTPDAAELSAVFDRLHSVFPGFRGYVGLDLLIQHDGSCVVVEINPRLTTSYIGYRQLTKMNLAERWLSPWPIALRPITWRSGFVSFAADGAVAHS